MRQLYFLHKAKARIKYEADVWQKYSDKYVPPLYRAMKVRMPVHKLSDYGITSQNAIDSIRTYAEENPLYIEKELLPNDEAVITQMTRDFGTTFQHFSIPLNLGPSADHHVRAYPAEDTSCVYSVYSVYSVSSVYSVYCCVYCVSCV